MGRSSVYLIHCRIYNIYEHSWHISKCSEMFLHEGLGAILNIHQHGNTQPPPGAFRHWCKGSLPFLFIKGKHWMLWDLIWGSLWNTGFWSKCFGIGFLPLTYLPPQIPAPVPNSISFKAKRPFRTQFSKFWFAQKPIDQHRGCIPQSALAVRKPQLWTFQTPNSSRGKRRWAHQQKGSFAAWEQSIPCGQTPNWGGEWKGTSCKVSRPTQAGEGRKRGGGASRPWGDCAEDENVIPNHANDKRERSWAGGDECVLLRFSSGPWCRFHWEPCSRANFHSAWVCPKMDSAHSCFDADCMVHF